MSLSTITIAGQTITLVELPAKPGLKSIEWDYLDIVAKVRSIFTGQSQRQKWPGADMLGGMANLPPLTVAQADDWEAFQMQLRGIANAFQMGDPLRTKPRGSGGSFGNAPLADNTQPGGNAAGSETLATKGWIANAQGVLLRGDWIQVGYRLYRVLDDVNADGSGNAIINIWPTIREVPTNDGSSNLFLLATGAAAKISSVTLGAYNFGAIWDSFSMVTQLPPDAVIQGIWPVIICSGVKDICLQWLAYGAVEDIGLGGGLLGTQFDSPAAPQATFASTEFTGTHDIGSSLSDLIGAKIGFTLDSSLFNSGPLGDTMTVTGVGYAVYYASATPITDPLMPPPFTVPSGQGVGWAVPFGVALLGPPSSHGSATATVATDNGGIIVNGAKGLFALSSNKRTSSADAGRLSRTSFPFEEYR